ncbi:MAG: hypothetical protein JW959_04405 [Pirellulales bacterium]|nr:hypothetical protein [Pirellulales bacterium]
MRRTLRLLPSAIALLGVAVFFAAAACAQGPAENDKKSKESINEQDIYIPYEKLREVFEKHGRGVFLPYEKFQELWRTAREKTPRAADEKPPVGALIAETENLATVEKDVLKVQAKLTIEVLAEGWNAIPLRLSDAAITRAALGGKPARIIGEPGQGYKLLIEKKGKEPETFTLELDYAKAISRKPGQNSVSFQTPQSPVSRWRVTIPQSGVKVDLYPLIAATEVPEAVPQGKPDQTVILAFVGSAPTVRIDWTPKAEGATGLEAMAGVQSEGQVWIDEGISRCRTALYYSISRAGLSKLEIDVPADQKVANVFDPNIRQWSVGTVDGCQRITAQLFEPAKSSQQIIVELEKIFPDESKTTYDVPAVVAVGAGRQQGFVAVEVAQDLRAEAVKSAGLLQIDAAELPDVLKRTKWEFAYRYAAVPYGLTLEIEKVRPRIAVDSLSEVDLQPELLALDLTTVYEIEKAGVFRLEWDIPPGFEVRGVRGAQVGDAKPMRVESHFLEGDGKTRLVVNLSHKAIGKAALLVHMEKDLDQPELMTPSGEAARFALPVPRVPEGTVERSDGQMIVYAPASLRVVPTKTDGLRNIPFQEAFEVVRPPRSQTPSERRQALAFAYSQGPAELVFTAERRKPQVIIRQLMVARIEQGVVKYDFTFFSNVLYSGVKSLRIDVPSEAASGLRVGTPNIRESELSPAPGDLEKGYVAWQLSPETEFLGPGSIKLTWEKKIDKLDLGKSVELTMPRLVPRDVDRAWGQIVLVKSETIDINPVSERNLRPIDPQRDLIEPVASAARAFEFHDAWELKIAATRYELEEVKRTSIERALVRAVVTQGNIISFQALYRMRSARQRLIVELPYGAEFDAQPLRIDGRPTALELGEIKARRVERRSPGVDDPDSGERIGGKTQFHIPLANADPEKPFVVELRYTLEGDGGRIDPPYFPQEPAVAEEYLCVYLPEMQRLLSAEGPWTREIRWFPDAWRWRPLPLYGSLVEWAQGDLASNDAAADFATDGDPYLFSTLRPAPPPLGSLRLKTMDGRLLSGMVFIVAVLLGLALLPARLPARALAVGAAIIALVLAGVFLPIFSMQILNGVLLAAVFIVAVMWAVVAAARCSARKALHPKAAIAEQGVDLSKYRPEPPMAEPAEKNKEEEGGKENE